MLSLFFDSWLIQLLGLCFLSHSCITGFHTPQFSLVINCYTKQGKIDENQNNTGKYYYHTKPVTLHFFRYNIDQHKIAVAHAKSNGFIDYFCSFDDLVLIEIYMADVNDVENIKLYESHDLETWMFEKSKSD